MKIWIIDEWGLRNKETLDETGKLIKISFMEIPDEEMNLLIKDLKKPKK